MLHYAHQVKANVVYLLLGAEQVLHMRESLCSTTPALTSKKPWMFTTIATSFFSCQIRGHHISIGVLIGGRQGFRGDHSVYPRNSSGHAAVTGMRYCVWLQIVASFCVTVFTVLRGHSSRVPTTDSLSQLWIKEEEKRKHPVALFKALLFRAEEKSLGLWLCMAEALNHRCRVRDVRKLTRATHDPFNIQLNYKHCSFEGIGGVRHKSSHTNTNEVNNAFYSWLDNMPGNTLGHLLHGSICRNTIFFFICSLTKVWLHFKSQFFEKKMKAYLGGDECLLHFPPALFIFSEMHFRGAAIDQFSALGCDEIWPWNWKSRWKWQGNLISNPRRQCFACFQCTYLKFSFCVLGVRDTYNLIICKLWKTLEVEDTSVYFGEWKHRSHTESFLGRSEKKYKGTEEAVNCRASHIKVPESQNSDDHGCRSPAFAVGAVKNEGWVWVLCQGTLHGLQQLIKILSTQSSNIETKTLKLKHNNCAYVYQKEYKPSFLLWKQRICKKLDWLSSITTKILR